MSAFWQNSYTLFIKAVNIVYVYIYITNVCVHMCACIFKVMRKEHRRMRSLSGYLRLEGAASPEVRSSQR